MYFGFSPHRPRAQGTDQRPGRNPNRDFGVGDQKPHRRDRQGPAHQIRAPPAHCVLGGGPGPAKSDRENPDRKINLFFGGKNIMLLVCGVIIFEQNISLHGRYKAVWLMFCATDVSTCGGNLIGCGAKMSKKRNLPAQPWYWGDWFKAPDVQCLSREDRCTWFEMIGRMWESNERGVLVINGRVPTDDELARLLGFGSDKGGVELSVNRVLGNGVCSKRESDGALYCRRIVHEEHVRKINTENGEKGGNPNLSVGNSVNQKGNRITEDEDEDEDESESRSSLNPEIRKDSIDTKMKESPDWRSSFEIYEQECKNAFQSMIDNHEYIAERERYHPGLNVSMTLEKACLDFWATESGWKHKKKGKIKNIKWTTTANASLSIKSNQVWNKK